MSNLQHRVSTTGPAQEYVLAVTARAWRLSGPNALRRLRAAKVPLTGASDHGVSEALYLDDPDHNGVELYWDRPPEQWPRKPDGSLDMFTAPLDLEKLLAEPVPEF